VAVGAASLVAVGLMVVAVGTGTRVLVAVILGRGVEVAKGVRVATVNGVLVGRVILVAVGWIRRVGVGARPTRVGVGRPLTPAGPVVG